MLSAMASTDWKLLTLQKNKTRALHVAAPVQLCPGTRELMQIRLGNKGHHEFNEYLILIKFDE